MNSRLSFSLRRGVCRGVPVRSIFVSDVARVSNLDPSLRRTVRLVALLNLAYFGIEFAVARSIGSVSLFADSIDFLEDTSVNLLILVALGWNAHRRARVGMALAGILLVPGISTLWTAYQKFAHPSPPDATLLSLTGLGRSRSIYFAPIASPASARIGAVSRAPLFSPPATTRWPTSPSSRQPSSRLPLFQGGRI